MMNEPTTSSTEKSPVENSVTKIFILPALFTAGNLLFGFLSIIRCIQAKYGQSIEDIPTAVHYYTQAVWFILLAFICDIIDGRVARFVGKESLFGKEFDSLADIISFGVAPALMMFFLILSPTEGFPFFRQVGWLIGFIYLLCAAVRLARFNVITHPLLPENQRQTNVNYFLGLPVPAAAGFIASLVLVLTKIDLRLGSYFTPGLMLLIAWLMVSKVPYPSFKTIDWRTQIRYRHFILIAITVASFILFKEFVFAFIFLGYIFYGLIRHLHKKCLMIKLNLKSFFASKRKK